MYNPMVGPGSYPWGKLGEHMSDQFRSGKLPTYPSPNLKLTFASDMGQMFITEVYPSFFC